ncbi:hypothetical protein [Lactococcus lactis]|uniref:hypothetical protein n=1 Tax=Lactococcus lactis TaxID=1358 RepID=UPI0032E51817
MNTETALILGLGGLLVANWFANIKTFLNITERFDRLNQTQNSNKHSLSKEHGQIKETLSKEHDQIQEALRNHHEGSMRDLVQIGTVVSGIKTELDETKNRIGNMTTSERDVKSSIETLQNFLDRSVNLREGERQRYKELQADFDDLKSYCHDLEQQVENKNIKIQELKDKIQDLTPKSPQRKQNRGHNGPTFN